MIGKSIIAQAVFIQMKDLKKNIQTEVDASYLYARLADNESDASVANIFRQMSEIEMSHAKAFAQKNGLALLDDLIKPSIRAKALNLIGKVFGYDYILGVLMDTERSLSSAEISHKVKAGEALTGHESNHVKILKNLVQSDVQVGGTSWARFEKKHRTVGGNAIRAAVLGGNDGLVSNFSLIMGVAGAAHDNKTVLLTGFAGLFAGALSMAMGEWISVKSSQELYENQMQLEMDEIEANPELEKKELALIYMAKGVEEAQAHKIAEDVMKDKNVAHQVLIKEELGINPEELKGSAFEAASYSFVLFAFGAIIPLFPFLFTKGYVAILSSVAVSTIGLFLIGSVITLFTGKSILFSGTRQVLFGLAAAAVTFGIGKLIGVSLG